MYHSVDAFESANQPAAVAHVAQKQPQLGKLVWRVELLQFPLLELVAAVDH